MKVKIGKPGEQIKLLAKQGYEVHVLHQRETLPAMPVKLDGMLSSRVDPRGGCTRVEIRTPSEPMRDDGGAKKRKLGELIAEGVAKCSKLDNYNKRTGLQIALGRAVADMLGEARARAERKEQNA